MYTADSVSGACRRSKEEARTKESEALQRARTGGVVASSGPGGGGRETLSEARKMPVGEMPKTTSLM